MPYTNCYSFSPDPFSVLLPFPFPCRSALGIYLFTPVFLYGFSLPLIPWWARPCRTHVQNCQCGLFLSLSAFSSAVGFVPPALVFSPLCITHDDFPFSSFLFSSLVFSRTTPSLSLENSRLDSFRAPHTRSVSSLPVMILPFKVSC